ncbi:hypothetical protein [Wukongibacter sp. M2B1]|uniref:hypothetical protein n=1 Tax=Wukongibacter sp. M2B1 TaxID=3088895 RepID=UPI003D7BDC2C
MTKIYEKLVRFLELLLIDHESVENNILLSKQEKEEKYKKNRNEAKIAATLFIIFILCFVIWLAIILYQKIGGI